jgi:serine/threonine-protein kinase
MGEVWRAHDSKLNRDVALKVLPDQFAPDADRLARFKREAQVLASLNHPHIGGIHGVEETNGIHALVLEMIEGVTLADRIARGAVPIDEALRIARQVAEALEAAHEPRPGQQMAGLPEWVIAHLWPALVAHPSRN